MSVPGHYDASAAAPDNPPTGDDTTFFRLEEAARHYLRRMGDIPRLTPEEEHHFAHRYQESRKTLQQLVGRAGAIILPIIEEVARSRNLRELFHQLDVSSGNEKREQLLQLQGACQAMWELLDRLRKLHRTPTEDAENARALILDSLSNLVASLPLREAVLLDCSAAVEEKWKEMEAFLTRLGESANEQERKRIRQKIEELEDACLMNAGEFRLLHERIRALEKIRQESKQALVEGNLRLVVSIVKKYLSYGMPFLDLVQEGNLGLIRAVEKFEVDRGHRFSTYATYWVRQSIIRALSEQGRIIRIPASTLELLRRIQETEESLLQELGEEPAPEAIAQKLGLSAAKVRALRKMSHQMISLQSTADEDGELRIGDIIPDAEGRRPDREVAIRLLHEALMNALDTLSPREREILILHYGLEQDTPMSTQQLSERYGLTRERIRQIEQEAFRKLRHPTRRHLLD